MPHDPITIRQDVIEKTTAGGHDRVCLTQYEAPCGPDGEIAEDPYKGFDEWATKQATAVLEAEYPDHFWFVRHESAQGVCLISVPILMGVNNYVAVNLKSHALDSHRVKMAGGEILERYRLRRGPFELAPFLEAREKHSALVDHRRKVPN